MPIFSNFIFKRAVAVVLLTLLCGTAQVALAAPKAKPEQIKTVMIGDRLVDIAYNLGVLPTAMSVRCGLWPECAKIKTASQILGCPNSLLANNLEPLLAYIKTHDIKRVMVEKNSSFSLFNPEATPERIAALLETQADLPAGLKIEYIDFNQGFKAAVSQTAQALDRAKQGRTLLEEYQQNMEKTQALIKENNFVSKVVILNGSLQQETGKIFIQVEMPGNYSDRFILDPLGSSNVGMLMFKGERPPQKGHVTIRKLDGLLATQPEVILLTGNTFAVQKKLSDAVTKNPTLQQVPAIANRAIYSMNQYVDSGVVEYPIVLREWIFALKK